MARSFSLLAPQSPRLSESDAPGKARSLLIRLMGGKVIDMELESDLTRISGQVQGDEDSAIVVA